jgi:nucleotide-binding universal stress UspA family protein
MTQARLTGAKIEAVAAWEDPSMGYSLAWHAAPYTDQNLAVIARKSLDHTIDELRTELDLPVQISARVEEGHPAVVLPEVSRGAQMLVLGSRGHGAFAGMMLGSVSQHCVQHMTCPVLVIPPSDAPQP